ncbi:MAG: hypothetical protein HFG64_09750 [Lachnospiraceae bacterium]|nr:hypothetical protein [Lachnospiraceae bacterium]
MEDYIYFSLTNSKYTYFKLISSNQKYQAKLYFVDYETGIATSSGVEIPSGEKIYTIGKVPAGDYVFVISSNGSVGDSYEFYLNATCPAGTSTQIGCSEDLRNVGREYSNGDIYANGVLVFNKNAISSDLFNWERKLDFQTGSSFTYRDLQVNKVVVDKIAGPCKYQSGYASSDSVMLIYCGIGTTWVYTESIKQGDNRTGTMVDVFGRKTPRQLDALDFDNSYTHILAYDVNTGRSIDFCSPLNYYYFHGLEKWPKIGD